MKMRTREQFWFLAAGFVAGIFMCMLFEIVTLEPVITAVHGHPVCAHQRSAGKEEQP